MIYFDFVARKCYESKHLQNSVSNNFLIQNINQLTDLNPLNLPRIENFNSKITPFSIPIYDESGQITYYVTYENSEMVKIYVAPNPLNLSYEISSLGTYSWGYMSSKEQYFLQGGIYFSLSENNILSIYGDELLLKKIAVKHLEPIIEDQQVCSKNSLPTFQNPIHFLNVALYLLFWSLLGVSLERTEAKIPGVFGLLLYSILVVLFLCLFEKNHVVFRIWLHLINLALFLVMILLISYDLSEVYCAIIFIFLFLLMSFFMLTPQLFSCMLLIICLMLLAENIYFFARPYSFKESNCRDAIIICFMAIVFAQFNMYIYSRAFAVQYNSNK